MKAHVLAGFVLPDCLLCVIPPSSGLSSDRRRRGGPSHWRGRLPQFRRISASRRSVKVERDWVRLAVDAQDHIWVLSRHTVWRILVHAADLVSISGTTRHGVRQRRQLYPGLGGESGPDTNGLERT